jgi:two-component system, NarL family, nitrate/nitrite sensor histidine kinase NarX
MLHSIRTRLFGIILILSSLILVSSISLYLMLKDHISDQAIISILEYEKSLNRQIVWLAISASDNAQLATNIEVFEQNLQSLQTGGDSIDSNGIIVPLPPSEHADLATMLDAVSQSWGEMKKTIYGIILQSSEDPARAEALRSIQLSSLIISNELQAISSHLTERENSEHFNLILIQGGFLAIALILFPVSFYILRNHFVQPLLQLNKSALLFGESGWTEPVETFGEDEISQLARSFDQMREAVLANKADLERRVSERTSEIMTAFDFSQEIVSQRDIGDLIRSVINKARTLMRAEDASLCLVTPDGCMIELASTTSTHAGGNKLVQPMDNNLPDMKVSRNQTIRSLVSSYGCAFLRHTPESQCLSAPLRMGDSVIGAMCVVRDKNQPFSDEESRAFSLLANSAAVAILNARHEEEAQQRVRKFAILSERERLASELHDNLAQTLNLVNLKVSQLQNAVIEPNNEAAWNEVDAVKINVESAIEQVRMISSEMASATKHNEDEFLAQLEASVKELEEASGVSVELFGTEAPLDRLSDLAQQQLLMIIREALTNIQRHAEAEEVAIRFSNDEDRLCVTIKDNGKGFQIESVQGSHHLGLRIMRTRAERSGGTLSLTSTPGEGSLLTVCLPITEQETG